MKHPKPSPPPLAAQHLQLPSSGKDLLNPAASEVLVSLPATGPLSTSTLVQVTPPPFPASDLFLTKWACNMAWSCPFHSIKHELDALQSWHVNLGFNLDGFTHGQLERAVWGIKCTHGLHPAASKLPITLPLLQAILKQLQSMPLSSWDHQVIAVAFAVSFACFLQCGKVAWNQPSPTQLLVRSVMWQMDYAILLLPASKTDPFRLGTLLVVPKVGRVECPYAMLHLLCPTIHRPDAPLFRLHDGYKLLTHVTFLQHLCLALSHLRLDTSQYVGHSFCQGAATWAALQGVDTDTIKLLSQWTSDCYH